nr:substrate-binding domain-containing protein [bacterium]
MKKAIGILASTVALALFAAGCGQGNEFGSSTPGPQETGTPDTTATAPAGSSFDASKSIVLISREKGSGTRGAFIELFSIEQKDEQGNKIDHTSEEAAITNNTSVMMTTVAGNPYAIGYISLGSLNDTVKALQIDGVEATVENIKNDTYKVSRPFNVVTKGEISEAAQDFMAFILSADGQAVVESDNRVSLGNTGAFTSKLPSGEVKVAGSSSVTPTMQVLKEAYEKINPNVKINIQESDSTTGINNTIDGICEIGMASRELKDSEVEKGVTSQVIAMDGVAVIVNPANTAQGLTSQQVKDIFTGTTTTWADVLD